MARMVIYRPDGTEVVRLTRLQRLKLGVAAFAGVTALVAFLAAAFLVGMALALPLAALALVFIARALWRVRRIRSLRG